VRLTTSTLSVSLLSTQYGALNISQSYNPSRPVRGVVLLFWKLQYGYMEQMEEIGNPFEIMSEKFYTHAPCVRVKRMES
jgi:hypothetical protein